MEFNSKQEAYMKTQGNLHSFIIGKDIIDATNREDSLQTCIDLHKAGLLRLPYPVIWVSFRLDDLTDNPNWYNQDTDKPIPSFMIFHFMTCDEFTIIKDRDGNETIGSTCGNQFYIEISNGQILLVDCENKTLTEIKNRGVEKDDEAIEYFSGCCATANLCLLTALATRNVVKRTNINNRIGTKKLSRSKHRGPGNIVYMSTTYLSVPERKKLEADPDHPAKVGVSPRPHQRRGHLHWFLYGKGKTERKQQYVWPVFVNADPAYIETKRYVVGRGS